MLPNGQLTLDDEVRSLNHRREEVINRQYSGQHLKIMALFRSRPGQWICLPDILALGVAQYNARILELRACGEQIENKIQVVNGQRHSWFRWLP